MNPKEKEEFDRIKKAFSKITADNKLSKSQVDDLMTDLTNLLGMYAVVKRKAFEELIKEMIGFGEKNDLAVEGASIQFKQIKQGKIKK